MCVCMIYTYSPVSIQVGADPKNTLAVWDWAKGDKIARYCICVYIYTHTYIFPVHTRI